MTIQEFKNYGFKKGDEIIVTRTVSSCGVTIYQKGEHLKVDEVTVVGSLCRIKPLGNNLLLRPGDIRPLLIPKEKPIDLCNRVIRKHKDSIKALNEAIEHQNSIIEYLLSEKKTKDLEIDMNDYKAWRIIQYCHSSYMLGKIPAYNTIKENIIKILNL